MLKHTQKPVSTLSTSFTRRKVLTQVVPASLAITLLGAEASTASAHVLSHTSMQQPLVPFSTNLAPGAAGFQNYAMVTATSTDGRIFYTWWQLGGGGNGWRELEGGGRTDATPAASFLEFADTGIQIDMFSAVKGLDGNIYTNTGGGFGNPFQGWVQLPGLQTTVAPAATVSNTNATFGVYLPVVVATSTDGRIFYNDTSQSIGWVELGGNGRTNAAPAAALVGGNYLFAVVKGLDGQLYLNQGTLGSSFVGWQSMGFTTNVAPGASSSGNTTALVATSTDGRIFYNWWQLGGGGNGWSELAGGGRTDAAPAAALVGQNNNYLFVIIKGLDGQLYLNQGQLGGSFTGWQLMS